MYSPQRIKALLIFLIVLDIVLSVIAIAFPEQWFLIFHDMEFNDPFAQLRRLGGVWVAFTLLQFLAYLRWEKEPYWLVLVAGVRLTELFGDWIYLGVAEQLTVFAKLGLAVSPPANLAFGVFLIKAYLSRQK